MKVSLNTIKQYTSVDLSVDELVDKLNRQLGGVEGVTDLRPKYKDAVIVKVVHVEKHPDADRLSVCIIDDGGVAEEVERITRDQALRASADSSSEGAAQEAVQTSTATEQRSEEDESVQQPGSVGGSADEQDGRSHGLVQVVCGAPNVHADMLAVWLPPGSTVPASFGTDEPFVLSARDIRGVQSNGMLAAADELAIGTDHEGIIELDPNEERPYDTPIAPGASFAEAYGLNDTIVDIENKMFTHRPDCFGQLGVAREIAGIQHQAFTSPSWYLNAPAFADGSGLELSVTNDAAAVVPRFMAVAIKDIEVRPSPVWLQCALTALGSKPINNIVDVTNYVMLLTGQPLHAYDYDKLRGHQLGVRLAHEGEQISLLNDKTYICDPSDILITDAEGPVGLGGVMGGGNSEVSADTKHIVLEAATFDMYTIRKTSMRHGLFTDAVTRFNKGQSPLQNPVCLNLALQSIYDTAGGSQASKVFDAGDYDAIETEHLQPISLDEAFINDRLGLSLHYDEVKSLLENVEFTVFTETDITVLSPFWRTDIELPEDVVEEVGRLYGFDKLPRELPARSIKPAPKTPMIDLKDTIRQVLSRAGGNEVLTYSFVHERTLKGAGQDPAMAYSLGNALSPDLQYYRLTIIPSLLEHVHSNIKTGHDSFVLFELGKGHTKGELDDEGLPKEFSCVAGVLAAKKSGGTAYYQAKRMASELLSTLGLDSRVTYAPFKPEGMAVKAAYFAPGRAATIMIGDEPIGRVGEFLPSVRKAFKLPDYCAGFELSLPKLLALQTGKTYTPLSRFPHTTQDISLKVAADVPFGNVYATARDAFKAIQPAETTAHLTTLGIYQPEDAKTKTITLRLKVASYEKTLKDAEVTTYLDAIATAAASAHQAERV